MLQSSEENVPFSPETARAGYEALKQRIDAVSDAELTRIRSPLLPMLSVVTSVARFVQAPAERAKFATLPDFDLRSVDDLHLMSAAYWYIHVQQRAARAGEISVMVDPELISLATELRSRMLSLLDYHLSGLPLVQRELDAIREGRGYEDLASDLVRLADVHEMYDSEINQDRRNYEATDAADARSYAMRIVSEATAPKQSASHWAETLSRCAALLDAAYREISDAAGWLYRNDPAAADRFPSLHGVRRRPSRAVSAQVRTAEVPVAEVPVVEAAAGE